MSARLRYLTLFEFNWLPALYAHEKHLGGWANVMPPDRQPGSTLIHRASQELIEKTASLGHYLPAVPAATWPLAPQAWLYQVAHELGLALTARRAWGSIEQSDVRRLIGLIGEKARSRCLDYHERYPKLAEAMPPGAVLAGQNELVSLGGQVLANLVIKSGLLAPVGASTATPEATELIEAQSHEHVVAAMVTRINLRFGPCQIRCELTGGALSDANDLLAELIAPASTRQAA